MTAPQANSTTTNYATHELPQHDYIHNVSAVPGQENDLYIFGPQKVAASVLPSVRNYENCPHEVRPGGLLESLTNRPHEGAISEADAAHRTSSSLASGPTKSTPATSPLFDKSSNKFVVFAEMEWKMEGKELEEVIEVDYDSGDDLKEFKEKWEAIRFAKRAEFEESVKSKKCEEVNSIEK